MRIKEWQCEKNLFRATERSKKVRKVEEAEEKRQAFKEVEAINREQEKIHELQCDPDKLSKSLRDWEREAEECGQRVMEF